MIRFTKKLIIPCALAIFMPIFNNLSSAQTVEDDFTAAGDWSHREHLELVPIDKLTPDTATSGNVLIRKPATDTTLEPGVIVYRVHGVSELVVKIYHKLGTFAVPDTSSPAVPCLLGGLQDEPRAEDMLRVYHSPQDDMLYLNHKTEGWLEAFSDDGHTFKFKKSVKTFTEANLGKELFFPGLSVYTSSYGNPDFKFVDNCSFGKVKRVQVFKDDPGSLYFSETLKFTVPPNTDCIKITLSAFTRYKEDDGSISRFMRKDNINSILISTVTFSGDKVDFNYHQYADDVTLELENAEALKIKEPIPNVNRVPKRPASSVSNHTRSKPEKIKEIIKIEKYFYEPAPSEKNMRDLIMVSPDSSSVAPNFDEEGSSNELNTNMNESLETSPKIKTTSNSQAKSKSKNSKHQKNRSKKTSSPKAKNRDKETMRLEPEEEQIIFLNSAPQNNKSEFKQKLLGLAYLSLVGVTVLSSLFGKRLKSIAIPKFVKQWL